MQETRNVRKYFLALEEDQKIWREVKNGKAFPDEYFFRQISDKYPLLLRWKNEGETYKDFYLRMIDSLLVLGQQYGIPYIPVSEFDPEYFYLNEREYGDVYGAALIYSLKLGDKELFNYLLGKGAKTSVYTFEAIGRIGSVPLLEFFLPYLRRKEWLQNTLHYAKRFNRKSLVSYLVDKGITEPTL